jgi:hypothetical protein
MDIGQIDRSVDERMNELGVNRDNGEGSIGAKDTENGAISYITQLVRSYVYMYLHIRA